MRGVGHSPTFEQPAIVLPKLLPVSTSSKFNNLDELEAGLREYTHLCNHSSIRLKLGSLSPVEYRAQAGRG
jgi:hypothetical protein